MVLDEDMWPRLAGELRGRGRAAFALKNTELVGAEDPDVIGVLGAWTDTMLITRDDNMPFEHAIAIADVGLTIAVVSPRTNDEFTEVSWEREIVHRWVHAMDRQQLGSIIRYTTNGRTVWRPRKRSGRPGRPRRRALPSPARSGRVRPSRSSEETITLPFDP
jgi:hypothetical protein